MRLPELDPERTVWSSDQIWNVARSGELDFVRPVRVSEHPNIPLHEMLSIADRAFSALTKLCDATVVPHTWGIIPFGDEQIGTLVIDQTSHHGPMSYKPKGTPAGYVLGALVETVINDYNPPQSKVDRLRGGLESYYNIWYRFRNRRGGLAYEAAKPNQFNFGTSRTITSPSFVLTDIEPIIHIKRK